MFLEPQIIISEGSCDTEDWSNDADNSALITGINYILNCRNMLLFLLYFWSDKCSIGEQKRLSNL